MNLLRVQKMWKKKKKSKQIHSIERGVEGMFKNLYLIEEDGVRVCVCVEGGGAWCSRPSVAEAC